MPQISIIVPIYKVDHYLQRCVDSIHTQTFTDYELILIDDGSPDLSGQIDDEYAVQDDRLISIHHKNGGVSSARNAGLDIAQGKHISFIDPDDYVLPHYLEELFHPEYDMVCQTVVKVDENEQFLKRGELPDSIYINPSEDDIVGMLFNTALHYTHCKCYNSTIIQNNHIRFNNEIDFAEDTLFSVEYLKYVSRVIVQNIANYQYVQYTSRATLSGRFTNQRIQMINRADHLISASIASNSSRQREIFIKRASKSFYYYFRDCYVNYSPFQLKQRISCLWYLTEDDDFHSVLQSGMSYGLTDEIRAAILSGSKCKVTFEYLHYCLYLLKKKLLGR